MELIYFSFFKEHKNCSYNCGEEVYKFSLGALRSSIQATSSYLAKKKVLGKGGVLSTLVDQAFSRRRKKCREDSSLGSVFHDVICVQARAA